MSARGFELLASASCEQRSTESRVVHGVEDTQITYTAFHPSQKHKQDLPEKSLQEDMLPNATQTLRKN
jgi:hypothetical protein